MKKKFLKRFAVAALVILSGTAAAIIGYRHYFADDTSVASSTVESDEKVLLGGIPVGIYMETKGVLVVDTAEIADESGHKACPAEHIVKSGDYIMSINQNPVSTKRELVQCVKNLQDEKVVLQMRRDNEEIKVSLDAVQNKRGEYQLGIWVRDDTQGLGTLTFVTKDGRFGTLGHGIHDADTGSMMEIAEGNLYDAGILSVTRGKSGTPGGLEGMIVYSPSNLLGDITKNSDLGIYGTLDIDKLEMKNKRWVDVAERSEAKTGKAYVYCDVDQEVGRYEIEIEKINIWNKSSSKAFVIRVTDKELLEKTGGIVQGMSGSPIVQNGKFVGAVTHVLVDDPTKGYGIFAETMLNTME